MSNLGPDRSATLKSVHQFPSSTRGNSFVRRSSALCNLQVSVSTTGISTHLCTKHLSETAVSHFMCAFSIAYLPKMTLLSRIANMLQMRTTRANHCLQTPVDASGTHLSATFTVVAILIAQLRWQMVLQCGSMHCNMLNCVSKGAYLDT